MQPAQSAGAFGDQVVAAVAEQPENDRLVLERDWAQPPVVEGSRGDRAGISQVGLAGAAGGQQPGPGRQLGRHVHDLLAGGDQQLGNPAAQAAGALHRPPSLGPLLGPGQQLGRDLAGDRQPLLAEHPAVGIQGDRGQGALVRVDADGDHWWPFRRGGTGSATGSLTSGWHTPLLSHVTAGAGRAPARYQRANQVVARSLRARRPAPWTLRAADLRVLAAIQQVRSLLPPDSSPCCPPSRQVRAIAVRSARKERSWKACQHPLSRSRSGSIPTWTSTWPRSSTRPDGCWAPRRSRPRLAAMSPW